PKEIDKFVLGDRNSNSIAINEHKAFLFSKDKNLLVIPVSMQEEIIWDIVEEGITPEEGMKIMPPIKKRYFNGAAIFNISKKGFELKGKISHSDENDNNYRWSDGVNRSLYINDVLYTMSSKYLKANWLNTLDEAKSIKLR
ncbi:MAG: beta-propeller domain-containing protein, partial [Candidatus Pacebacteria bacterium]|nr:beta-propeller domain-containing protein [Candidatus Paceibacterota bacterium]